MIEVSHLTKRYGKKYAVRDISFKVNDGEILGFLGPNGAGKSTTMNILTGCLSATDGVAKIDGIDVLEDPLAAKKKIGFLPELPPIYMDMTVEEYLKFVYSLKKCDKNALPREEHIADICKRVRIDDVYKRLIKNLSKGYKQRVGLAQALIGNPEVLILDEPTVGHDPRQIIDIRNLVKELGERHTIILSSHILPEVQATCSRVIVINQGEILADGTPEDLSKVLSGGQVIIVKMLCDKDAALAKLEACPDVRKVSFKNAENDGSSAFVIEGVPDKDVRFAVFEIAKNENWPIIGVENHELTLEEIFLELVKKQEKEKKAQQEVEE